MVSPRDHQRLLASLGSASGVVHGEVNVLGDSAWSLGLYCPVDPAAHELHLFGPRGTLAYIDPATKVRASCAVCSLV